MKVTTKTRCVERSLYTDEVIIKYRPDSSEPIPRVVEFPKVWREGGKQYKVTTCAYYHNGDYHDEVTIKASWDTTIHAFNCSDTKEYY